MLGSCSKEIIDSNSKTLTQKSNLRTASVDSTKTSDITFDMLTSPVRDILKYNPDYFNIIARTSTAVVVPGENYHCCNGICLTVPTNPDPGTFYYPFDAFGNRVQYTGQYGPDPRNRYYVYLPTTVNINSPIVLMIPGGGWCSGPDLSVLGYPFNFGVSNNESIVKDLLNNGYVVVSMIYRLVQLGNNQAEFLANPISWQNQIDDITLAITHIRANFPTPNCLYGTTILNANKIHLLGESAGGHLALMYAYTHPNQTYIKSVISMYAPTNLQTTDNWIKNIPASSIFSCTNPPSTFNAFGTSASIDCALHTKTTSNKSPYNWPVNYNPSNPEETSYFPNTCIGIAPNQNPTDDIHIYPGHNLFQSARQNSIPTPLVDASLSLFSPRYTPNIGCYPTFIMHGREDVIIPYNEGTTGMQSALLGAGGVVFTDNVVSATAMPSSYTTPHLIRKYCIANHGWVNYDPNYVIQLLLLTSLRNKVRSDVVTWYNNH